MVVGVNRACHGCGRLVRTCVLPAYCCEECEEQHRAMLAEMEQQVRNGIASEQKKKAEEAEPKPE